MEEITQLREIADKLGFVKYPEELEAIFEAQRDSQAPACDLAEIDRLQETYDLFGEFFDLVKKSAQIINADPELNAYVRAAIEYNKQSDRTTAIKLPAPQMTGRIEMDFMMLHITIPMVEASFQELTRRGFTWEDQADAREVYKRSMRIVQTRTDYPGINGGYFSWLALYCRVGIFMTGGFWFEIKQLYARALWIRNCQTGQMIPLMQGRFYCDGTMMVGAKGFEDQTDSFVAEYSEDAENFYGHACVDNVVSRESASYPKTLWESAGRPGEYCLSIHVPPKTDISREATLRACREGMRLMGIHFPEYEMTKVVFCASWLLNPRLKEIQGEQSRIAQFLDCFVKYPIQDAGQTILSFVFGKIPENLEDLQEDTSLQRKLKKLYLDGGLIHSYSGALYVE